MKQKNDLKDRIKEPFGSYEKLHRWALHLSVLTDYT